LLFQPNIFLFLLTLSILFWDNNQTKHYLKEKGGEWKCCSSKNNYGIKIRYFSFLAHLTKSYGKIAQVTKKFEKLLGKT